MIESYILKKDIETIYLSDFSRYYIFSMYGNDILIGDDIESEYKTIEGD